MTQIFFNKYKDDPDKLNQKVTVKEENIVRGSGIVHLLDKNLELTYLDLVKLMIIVSDNAAANEIVDAVGWESVEKYMNDLGLNNTTFRHKMRIKAGRGPNFTTSEDMTNEIAFSIF